MRFRICTATAAGIYIARISITKLSTIKLSIARILSRRRLCTDCRGTFRLAVR